MAITSKNAYLSQSEMEGNAAYIWAVLSSYGWTIQAVAATLANMQAESTVNPAIYEGLDATSSTNGFGLVQWTPNTKYKTWADANGYAYGDINGQLARIRYELDNGLQWITTDMYPLTFKQYTESTLDVSILCYAFMYNYERPASLDQPHRIEYARSWLNFLQGTSPNIPIEPSEPTARKKGLPLIYKYIALRR